MLFTLIKGILYRRSSLISIPLEASMLMLGDMEHLRVSMMHRE